MKIRTGLQALALTLLLAATSFAAPITQLGFVLDASGSVGSTNFATVRSGLAAALLAVVPTNSTVEISVVRFASGANTFVFPTLIDSAATLTSVTNQILAIPYIGGTTNTAAGITTITNQITGSPYFTNPDGSTQVINIVTDGVPNIDGQTASQSQTSTLAAATAAVAAGIDEIDLEAIGDFDLTNLLAIAYPGAGVIAPPFQPGFVLPVANFNDFPNAIRSKIQFIIAPPPAAVTPEPTSIALWTLGVVGVAAARRFRKRKAIA